MLTITATELTRFVECNGSRSMTESHPVIDTPNDVRDEGNAADWVIKEVIEGRFTPEELIDRKAPNGVYIDVGLIDHLQEYLDWILPRGFIEVETNHCGQGWMIKGRADHIFYDETVKVLYVSDFKYGWGIVEPEMNWTLISHAIGWLSKYRQFEVNEIVFKIFQPRPRHPKGCVREWVITKEHLDELFIRINATMTHPSNNLHTGEHCYKCPALANCPAARKAQLNAIDASENAFNAEIDNESLSFQLDHIKRAIKVLQTVEKAYIDLATHRLKEGQNIDNYSLTTELSNLNWLDNVDPDFVLGMSGIDIRKTSHITPTQAKSAGVSEEIIERFATREKKGLKLERISNAQKAEKIFNFNQPPKGKK